MELIRIIHWLIAPFVFKLINFSPSFSFPSQGNELPYMTSDIKEVSGKSFDYIIVGGGTSGCPLAATLSERFSVLLIERGGSPYGNPLVLDKKNYGYPLIQTDEFSSVAQSFISEDGIRNHRGRVLGGSTAINGGFYSRASEDYIRRVQWDEKLVKDAYEWVESRIVSIPELSLWQSVAVGGLLEAGILPYNGFSFEHIEGTKVGGSLFDAYGRRHTSADLLGSGNPRGITVLLNATVRNVIFHNDGNKPRAYGVRFIRSIGSTGRTFEAYLNRPNDSGSWGDIILSAGALGSPQILLLSGIGSHEHLNNFNVPVVIDLKGVGQGIQDNPCIALPVDPQAEARLPDPPQVVGIADDFKIIVESGISPISPNATRIIVAAKLAFISSKGKLELNGTDPRQNPSVKFNYLKKIKDLNECVKMSQLVKKVARSNSITQFLGNWQKDSIMSGEDEMRTFCKKNVKTYYHYHGGCLVGSVVDKDYKVYGVEGLRVVDGSTFQDSPGTNPMATLLMLGRYQGIKILREWKDASTAFTPQIPFRKF